MKRKIVIEWDDDTDAKLGATGFAIFDMLTSIRAQIADGLDSGAIHSYKGNEAVGSWSFQ